MSHNLFASSGTLSDPEFETLPLLCRRRRHPIRHPNFRSPAAAVVQAAAAAQAGRNDEAAKRERRKIRGTSWIESETGPSKKIVKQ